MKHAAWSCLAALAVAAWTAGAPLCAVAQNKGPEPGLNDNNNHNPKPATGPTASGSNPASKSTKRETYPFRGVVASVDPPAHTVTLEGRNSSRVIAVTPETNLTREGSPTTLEDVKTGERVGGMVKKNPDGREEAVLLRVGLKAKDPGEPGQKVKTKAKSKSKAHSPAREAQAPVPGN